MTEFVFVKGKVKWFKPHVVDNRFGDAKWKHVLYPDAESIEKINKLKEQGLKNIIKKDEDGYYVTFSRPFERKLKDGTRVGMMPPEVLGKDGIPLKEGILVGNGSDVTTKLEVYSHASPGGGKAKAARWLSTRIDNLVPFVVNRDFEPDQQRAVKDLMDQPEPLF
jgi:hypothetical protein